MSGVFAVLVLPPPVRSPSHDVVEVVVFDQQADALGVQVLVGDGRDAAAQQPSAGDDAGRPHAAAEVDHLPGLDRRPRHAGASRRRDVVQVGAASAVWCGRRPGRLHGGVVAVVERRAGDPSGVQQLRDAGDVVDVVVRDDREIDRRDAERVEQRGDFRAAAAERRRRRAAFSPSARRSASTRPGRRRRSRCAPGGFPLGVRTLREQKKNQGGKRRQFFRHVLSGVPSQWIVTNRRDGTLTVIERLCGETPEC